MDENKIHVYQKVKFFDLFWHQRHHDERRLKFDIHVFFPNFSDEKKEIVYL